MHIPGTLTVGGTLIDGDRRRLGQNILVQKIPAAQEEASSAQKDKMAALELGSHLPVTVATSLA